MSKQKKDLTNDKKDTEINDLRKDILKLRQILNSSEDQNLKFSELEKKFRTQIIKSEKDIKNLEENYEEKIKNLNKKIFSLEERLKNSNINYKSYSYRNEEIQKPEKSQSSVSVNFIFY